MNPEPRTKNQEPKLSYHPAPPPPPPLRPPPNPPKPPPNPPLPPKPPPPQPPPNGPTPPDHPLQPPRPHRCTGRPGPPPIRLIRMMRIKIRMIHQNDKAIPCCGCCGG